jgi:hypothetical protein
MSYDGTAPAESGGQSKTHALATGPKASPGTRRTTGCLSFRGKTARERLPSWTVLITSGAPVRRARSSAPLREARSDRSVLRSGPRGNGANTKSRRFGGAGFVALAVGVSDSVERAQQPEPLSKSMKPLGSVWGGRGENEIWYHREREVVRSNMGRDAPRTRVLRCLLAVSAQLLPQVAVTALESGQRRAVRRPEQQHLLVGRLGDEARPGQSCRCWVVRLPLLRHAGPQRAHVLAPRPISADGRTPRHRQCDAGN